MAKLTREQRLAAREGDTMTTPAMKVVELVMVQGQKMRLLLPDGNILILHVRLAEGGYCEMEFTKGEQEDERDE